MTPFLFFALLAPQLPLPAGAPAAAAAKTAETAPAAHGDTVRTEKLTPDEVKQIADATQKLEQAKRELHGLEDGIAQHHGALTDCGCYVNRQPDTYVIKGDEIVVTTKGPAKLTP